MPLAALRRSVLAAGDSLPSGPPAAIAAYLAAERALGRVRPDVDPVDAAIVLLATLFGLAMSGDSPGIRVAPARISAAVRLLTRGLATSSD